MTVNEESLYLGLLLGQKETSLRVWKTVTRLFFSSFFSNNFCFFNHFRKLFHSKATTLKTFSSSSFFFFFLGFPHPSSSSVAEQIDPGTVRCVFPCPAYYINYVAFVQLFVSSMAKQKKYMKTIYLAIYLLFSLSS